jgi:hypothetical protein
LKTVARPSHHELNRKLTQARDAVESGHIGVINPDAAAEDAQELGYLFEDVKEFLSGLLMEVGPQHYAGGRPPQKSYEEEIKGCELFAFRWKSRILDEEVYLKFTVKEGSFWLVSLHKHKKRT